MCIELQRLIWGYTEVECVPARTLAVAIKIGGHVLVARDGVLPIGFALAFPGRTNGIDHLHSNMVGVLPAYQGCGVGFKLKARQREIALGQGLENIEWTFDTLAQRNAYFNLVRLGAIVRRIHANLYGISKSPLHAGMPTDRFVAEWPLTSQEWPDACREFPLQRPRLIHFAFAYPPLSTRSGCRILCGRSLFRQNYKANCSSGSPRAMRLPDSPWNIRNRHSYLNGIKNDPLFSYGRAIDSHAHRRNKCFYGNLHSRND